MKITFVGGGNMANAIIVGLRKTYPNAEIHVVDPNPDALQSLLVSCQTIGARVVQAAHLSSDLLIIATKPQQVPEALSNIRAQNGNNLDLQPCILSIAAGVRAESIRKGLGGAARVVRTMPNTPALIGRGVTALYASPGCTETDLDLAHRVMASVGECTWVTDESLLDAVTAVSGSGPAYVFYLIEAMRDAALQAGLPTETAMTLVLETVAGAAELARASAESPETLRARVTSKGGTTAAAIESFDHDGVHDALVRGVIAARNRAEALGRQ